MRQVNYVRWITFMLAVCLTTAVVLPAQGAPFGSRLKKLSWFGGDSDDAASSANGTSTPRVATRQTQTTFAPSPLAPEPSVTMPAPTAPTGEIPTAPRNEKPKFGSRILSAMSSTREGADHQAQGDARA